MADNSAPEAPTSRFQEPADGEIVACHQLWRPADLCERRDASRLNPTTEKFRSTIEWRAGGLLVEEDDEDITDALDGMLGFKILKNLCSV
ncbi:hypothetical protein PM082_011238 [Marasmius tenuissimus]|nr:hypothetical protein PM082_011238 [Marasmius tenuissimus]